jgi:hypothetical protein
MRWKPWLLLPAAVLLGGAARHPKSSPCDGRYLVRGVQLITGAGDTVVTGAVTVHGGAVSVGSGCPAVAGTVRATPKGTRVRDRWPSCGNLQKARLKAFISADCETMHGRFGAKGDPPHAFEATHSECGDGIIDRLGDEQCEADADCGPGARCDRCGCVPETTTTTLPCGAPGTACTQGSQCCGDKCSLGSCDCVAPGDLCVGGSSSCCGAPCVNGRCCRSGAAAPCTTDKECCSGMCVVVANLCGCISTQGGCVDDAQCCSGHCGSGACCLAKSILCAGPADCCSGSCSRDPIGLFRCD